MPPPKPRFVVADGHIDSLSASAAGLDPSTYLFQFSSGLILCGTPESTPQVGRFVNNVKCRKWTDTDGDVANTQCHVAPPGPPQPANGCLVNVGDVTLTIDQHAPPPRTIDCPNFKLEGTQTHRTQGAFVVFLFAGEGTAEDGAIVKGVGSCLETLVPAGAPRVDSWNFVFTIC